MSDLSFYLSSYILGTDPPIVFKRVTTYEFVYNNARTIFTSNRVSVWRPKDNEYGYYALGDVAVASHDKPNVAAAMVKEIVPGSLAIPIDFTEVWNDKRSLGYFDVRIMRMTCPEGYTCLGHVAVIDHESTPDAKKYR